jgi:hypothetical protein
MSTVVLGSAYHCERRGPQATKALETIDVLLSTTGMRSGLLASVLVSGSYACSRSEAARWASRSSTAGKITLKCGVSMRRHRCPGGFCCADSA